MNLSTKVITCWLLLEQLESELDDELYLLISTLAKRDEDVLSLLARVRRARYHSMTMEERRNRRQTFPVSSLVSPSDSPAQRILDSRCDQSYITMTGLDVATFDHVLELFEPLFEINSPHSDGNVLHGIDGSGKKGGRKRSITAAQALCLYLTWTRTQGKLSFLQLIFGMGHSSVSKYIRFARQIIIHVLIDHPEARIALPAPERLRDMQQVVASRYPLIEGAALVMDGLKFLIKKSSFLHEQSRYYNGWQHSHWIVNVFVFDLTGRVVSAAMNAPGSWHDSTVAESFGVYDELREVYDAYGIKTVVDSAFKTTGENSEHLIKSGDLNPDNPAVNAQATSFRQAAEWGVGNITKGSPRLLDKFEVTRDGDRDNADIILSIVLLHNLKCARVGINQLNTVFNAGRTIHDLVNIPHP